MDTATNATSGAVSVTAVVPHIVCRNAEEAYEFYQKAFGAKGTGIHKTPDGKVMHAALDFGGGLVFLNEEMPEWGAPSPLLLNGTPFAISLSVTDADTIFNRAVEAGCTVVMPLEDMFWGDRYGVIQDPYGHRWSISKHVRDVPEEEIQQAMANMDENCGQ